MCGLVMGLGLTPAQATRVLEAMSYRGTLPPQISEGDWTIGHTRLPIQSDSDTSPEQPFTYMKEAMAFVGEIFGVPSEEDALWRAISTPMLRGFHELDGFWSVVYSHHGTGKALAITDHLGIKPLYYWADRNMICSEITPMFAAFPPPEMDPIYLSNCLKFGYDYSGRTPWKGVSRVPSGTVLTLSPMGPEFTQATPYWDWKRVPKGEALFEDFMKSTQHRVEGVLNLDESPVALLMSGGLDSSTVLWAAKALGVSDLIDPIFIENEDDGSYIPKDFSVIRLSPSRDPVELRMEEMVRIMQEPVDLGSVAPQIQLARALKGYRVILTGDGADELFGGYRRAKEYDSQASDVFCELPAYHLPRLDRVHMRFTQEVRSPFLAPSVIRHALELPWGRRTNKQEVREIGRRLGVPANILDRPKTPLKTPSVRDGGINYRKQLMKEFYHVYC